MSVRNAPVRWLVLIFALCPLLAALGCSGGTPFKMAPAKGTVKFKDGTIPKGEIAEIHFDPDGIPGVGAMSAKTASGDIGPDGSFVLKTGDMDGAAVGKHKVRLTVFKTYVGRESVVPEKYTAPATTPLAAEVTASGPNSFEFTVDKP